MRRVFYTTPDTDPSRTIEVLDVDEPRCPDAGVLVAVEARPINPADLLLLTGRHVFTPTLPATVGIEGAGRVIAAGPTSQLRPGDVVGIPRGGTWSERLAFEDDEVLRLPAGVDIEQAAMLCVNPFTAVGLLEGLAPGATIVLNAGTSAVSRLVLSLARRRGLRALAVVRDTRSVDELLNLGAAAVLVDGDDLAQRLRDAAGAPIVRGLDAVAGAASGRLFDAIAEGGDLIVYGLLSSSKVELPAANLVFRDVTVRGYSRLRCYAALSPARRVEIGAELVELVTSGDMITPIAARYPLERAREAIAHHERPGRQGKILLVSPAAFPAG
jgi:NADPH:quinone reductase-like Zn-dependent oxidoreductase